MITRKEIEREEVRQAADSFKDIILQKQADYDKSGKDYTVQDLIKGTPYEGQVEIEGDVITHEASLSRYRWCYTPRVGNFPAYLTEDNDFLEK